MPADSEGTPDQSVLSQLPRTWRPVGPMIVAVVLVLGLGVVLGVCWVALGPEEQAKFTTFELWTLAFIGVLILACVHALTRSRVTATAERLVVVNGYRKRELEWAEVVAIGLPSGAPWVRMDLAHGEEISAMGIQATDGQRSRDAVRLLRRIAEEATS